MTIPDDELNEALRRALVVRAVGGDPLRDLELDEDAVARLAEELDSEERRERLQLGIASLREREEVARAVEEQLATLVSDPDLSWRCFAASLLAAELADPS